MYFDNVRIHWVNIQGNLINLSLVKPTENTSFCLILNATWDGHHEVITGDCSVKRNVICEGTKEKSSNKNICMLI